VITLVGLGSGDEDSLSLGARRALKKASELHRAGGGKLYLRTELHPIVGALREWGLDFESFDSLYNTSPDFETVYRTIAETIIAAASQFSTETLGLVTYAVPGHPLFAEDSVRQIRAAASEQGIPIQIVGSGSFVEAVLTAVGSDLGDGCDVRDALSLPQMDNIGRDGNRMPGRPDTTRALMLYQIFDGNVASRTKLALMRDYPDDWEVTLVRRAGIDGQQDVRRIPLFRLDHEPVDYLTSLYVPPLPPETRRARFPELVGIMSRLRAPDGCPWDREQTPKTLRKYFIEETYEAIEAIDNDDPELLCEELGDVLLQVVFHAQLAAEKDDFNIDDVTDGIVSKLVRRHPHVFGDVNVEESAEVLRNWEKIKKEEKKSLKSPRRDSALDGVPKGLPALMQAMEISKRAAKVGFEWSSLNDVLSKLDEEIEELRVELNTIPMNTGRVFSELGDLLFTVVQIARWNKLDSEEALRSMIARFEKRFRFMERVAGESGKSLADLDAKQLDQLWGEAKREV
jgi:tetrapyrrole methylase family protein/MazG family protein